MSKLTSPADRFIVIEGVDGAGKGVQSRALHDAMQAAGLPVLLTREPGGSEGAEQIRELLVSGAAERWDDMTELLLVNAARRAHLRDTILPALEAGTWVVCDRFIDSTRAFQGEAGGVGLGTINTLHHIVTNDFNPVLTLVLDLDPALSLQRAGSRGGGEDRFEHKGLEYQCRVREAFLQLAASGMDSHVLIDAARPVAEVTASVLKAVNSRLGLPLQEMEAT